MKIGLLPDAGAASLPHFRDLRDQALAAEQAGFASFWLADHLIYRFPDQPESGRWEAMTMLSGLAAATTRITLGPLVACTSFRNPALLAKMADGLDDISNGRFILGLGAGWHEPEYAAFGYPFDHLASRFEEALQVIVPLLRTGEVDFAGQYAEAHTRLIPRGPTPAGPPIWIGASRPRMLRLVAQYADAWNTVWHLKPERVMEEYARLLAACDEVGRDPATLELTAGTMARVLAPGEERNPDEKAIVGTAEEVAAALKGFATSGVKHLIVALVIEGADNIQRFVPAIERFAPVITLLNQGQATSH